MTTLDERFTGLIAKYRVERLNDATGKHDDCRYFVLDPLHDPIARVALAAYASAALDTHPFLTADLRRWLSDLPDVGADDEPPTDHDCDTGDFDRTLCPEPCGAMHSYCSTCGRRMDPCDHQRESSQPKEIVMLTPAAKALNNHLIVARSRGRVTCQGCDPKNPEIFETEAEYLNHVAEAVRKTGLGRDETRDTAARREPLDWPGEADTLTERRAIFIYEAARMQADAVNATIVPEPWHERDEKFRTQFLSVIDMMCGPDRKSSPEELHDDWTQAYEAMGWRYGPVRDVWAKTHPDMVPFDQLGYREQIKDAVFIALCEIARQWIAAIDDEMSR
jgi:hypothetical protein